MYRSTGRTYRLHRSLLLRGAAFDIDLYRSARSPELKSQCSTLREDFDSSILSQTWSRVWAKPPWSHLRDGQELSRGANEQVIHPPFHYIEKPRLSSQSFGSYEAPQASSRSRLVADAMFNLSQPGVR